MDTVSPSCLAPGAMRGGEVMGGDGPGAAGQDGKQRRSLRLEENGGDDVGTRWSPSQGEGRAAPCGRSGLGLGRWTDLHPSGSATRWDGASLLVHSAQTLHGPGAVWPL